MFGLPCFCAFQFITDPVQGCLLLYGCVSVSASDKVHTRDRGQLHRADCCGIAEGHQQCIKVASELASWANEVQIASAVTQALTFVNSLAVLCCGGALGTLLCHIQDTQQRTMTPKTRSIEEGIKPKPAGLCLCDVTCNCVQKCSEKGVRPHWHALLLWEHRVIYISFSDTHKCPSLDVYFPRESKVTGCHRPVLQDMMSLRQHIWRWMLMIHGGTSLWIPCLVTQRVDSCSFNVIRVHYRFGD